MERLSIHNLNYFLFYLKRGFTYCYVPTYYVLVTFAPDRLAARNNQLRDNTEKFRAHFLFDVPLPLHIDQDQLTTYSES